MDRVRNGFFYVHDMYRNEQTGTERDKQGQTGTDRTIQGQKGISRDRLRQTETDYDR